MIDKEYQGSVFVEKKGLLTKNYYIVIGRKEDKVYALLSLVDPSSSTDELVKLKEVVITNKSIFNLVRSGVLSEEQVRNLVDSLDEYNFADVKPLLTRMTRDVTSGIRVSGGVNGDGENKHLLNLNSEQSFITDNGVFNKLLDTVSTTTQVGDKIVKLSKTEIDMLLTCLVTTLKISVNPKDLSEETLGLLTSLTQKLGVSLDTLREIIGR